MNADTYPEIKCGLRVRHNGLKGEIVSCSKSDSTCIIRYDCGGNSKWVSFLELAILPVETPEIDPGVRIQTSNKELSPCPNTKKNS